MAKSSKIKHARKNKQMHAKVIQNQQIQENLKKCVRHHNIQEKCRKAITEITDLAILETFKEKQGRATSLTFCVPSQVTRVPSPNLTSRQPTAYTELCRNAMYGKLVQRAGLWWVSDASAMSVASKPSE